MFDHILQYDRDSSEPAPGSTKSLPSAFLGGLSAGERGAFVVIAAVTERSCRVDVSVRNMEQFEEIHEIQREHLGSPTPPSTMVEVTKMASPNYLIEMRAIAVVPDPSAADREALV